MPTKAELDRAIGAAQRAFLSWRDVPAPKRGELVRRFGEALRAHKRDLGRLVTLETGKILAEGEGEVQEMIDICDFAVGLSRQLHGLTIASERPAHRMMEQWHPLGVVGIISAFNFPVAVWSWNSVLAAVCGDATIWKPSDKTPLTAIACVKLAERVCREAGADPAIFSLVCGDAAHVGEPLIADPRVALVSATGSTRMGRRVAEVVSQRLGRTLLELGGNNAIIVAPSADLKLALRAILFGAVGTAGQRCTTTRRLIVHESIYTKLMRRLKSALPAGAHRQSARRRDAHGAADRRRCRRELHACARRGEAARRARALRWQALERRRIRRADFTSRPASSRRRTRGRSCNTKPSRRFST